MKFKSDSQRRAVFSRLARENPSQHSCDVFARIGNRFSTSSSCHSLVTGVPVEGGNFAGQKGCNRFSLIPKDSTRDLIGEQKALLFRINHLPENSSREDSIVIVRRLDAIDRQLRDRDVMSQSAGNGFADAIVGMWPDRDSYHRGAAGSKVADAVVGLWPGESKQEVDQFGNIIHGREEIDQFGNMVHRRSAGDSFSDAITGLWPG